MWTTADRLRLVGRRRAGTGGHPRHRSGARSGQAEAGGDREALADVRRASWRRPRTTGPSRLRELPAAVFGVLRAADGARRSSSPWCWSCSASGCSSRLDEVTCTPAPDGLSCVRDGWTWSDWWGAGRRRSSSPRATSPMPARGRWRCGRPLPVLLRRPDGVRASGWPIRRGGCVRRTRPTTATSRSTEDDRRPGARRAAHPADQLPPQSGWLLQFITPARPTARGTHAVIRLPAGVTAEKHRAVAAPTSRRGCHRVGEGCWPSTGSEAGILDLWVPDKGALAEGAGPYPLLDYGSVDVFKGVPFGRNLRGTPITAPIMERNSPPCRPRRHPTSPPPATPPSPT